jgi:Ca2+-binding RTX toxin-like protein
MVGLDGADRLYGGYMIDDLDGGLGNDRLYGGYEDDYLYGKGGDDQLYGETDDDYLYGGDGKDRLDGGSGSDTMEGGAGNDVYYVSLDDDGAVEDTITEAVNSGSDTVYVPYEVETYVLPDNVEILKMNAGFGNSSVTGNTANNTIVANAGDNEVDGGAGSDLITGGKGADELTGGSGNDSFVYNSTKDSNSSDTDIIWDFSLGDKVDLSGIDSKASVVGNQAFTFITSLKSGTFAANTEGTVGFYKDYLYANTDSDSDAEFVIKVIGLDITSANLLVL